MVPTMVNVVGLPYVIPDRAWPPSGHQAAKRVMSRPALTGRKMHTEEADPARGAAHRDRTAERASTSAFGSAAVTSALRAAAMTTAVAVMAVATAVVDGNAA